jgi:hypothetical protein
MESDPVAHMIGVISVEPPGMPLWFDIIGTWRALLALVILLWATDRLMWFSHVRM